MKKLSWILTIFLLLALCACAKPPAPEQSMPEAAELETTEAAEEENANMPDAAASAEDTDGLPEAAESVVTESTEEGNTNAPDTAALAENAAEPVEDADYQSVIAALVENARTGASYEYVYYDVCTTDDERAAFEDDIRTAKDAFRAYLAANREGFAWNQSENLQAQLSIYDDCSVSLQIYDGNLCAAEFRYLPDTGVSEVGA